LSSSDGSAAVAPDKRDHPHLELVVLLREVLGHARDRAGVFTPEGKHERPGQGIRHAGELGIGERTRARVFLTTRT
jgi:hypothetical protein